jgi:hypothetical protein
VYYVLVCASLLCFAFLIVVRVLMRTRTQAEVQDELDGVVAAVRAALDEDSAYKEARPLRDKLTTGVVALLSLLYMPVTQQSLQAVFCHRSIMCEYDCYNEPAHNTLVVVGVVVLVVITTATPLLYAITTRGVVQQYHTYLGVYDTQLQDEHWELYTELVKTPFASLYGKYVHGHCYFECVMLLFKAVMAAFLIALAPESIEQLISVCVLQAVICLFVSVARPMLSTVGNNILVVCHVFLATVLFLTCGDLLGLDATLFGVLTVAAMCTFLVLAGSMIGYAALRKQAAR